MGISGQYMDCNWISLKITRLLFTNTCRKCAAEVWIWNSKPNWSSSLETKKSNMATRRPFWKWHIWKSIGFFPYTLVMCYWSLDLIFKAKQKLESGNRKIQAGCQAAILKVTLLKINRLLPIATNNMHMKFQIEIPKQTWVTLRKPCRLQTDRQTDRRTRSFQYSPHQLRCNNAGSSLCPHNWISVNFESNIISRNTAQCTPPHQWDSSPQKKIITFSTISI